MVIDGRSSRSNHEVQIPPAAARTIQATAGSYVTVVDLEGQQIGDFVALNAKDFRERLSTCHTRSVLHRIYVHEGDQLYSNQRRPFFEIVEDQVSVHDITIAACDAHLYAQRHGLTDHPSCLDNLTKALAPFGVEEWQVPEPFNIFQNSRIDTEGNYHFETARSRPGDRLVLRALVDVVVAVSSCAYDQSSINGARLTSLLLRVSTGRPA